MASQESMAIRCNEALDTIESIVSEMLGADVESVARVHRDRDMLRVIQLEQIAKWLGELQEAEKAPVKDVVEMFEVSMAKADYPNRKPRK